MFVAYGSCCGQIEDICGDLFWHVLQQAYDHTSLLTKFSCDPTQQLDLLSWLMIICFCCSTC